MKTRGKGSTKTAAEAIAVNTSIEPKFQLKPESGKPPKVFVLPEGITSSARIVTIAHPRHSAESRYLCCPDKGFYEFKTFSAPKSTPRSLLLVPSKTSQGSTEKQTVNASTKDDGGDYEGTEGYVTNSADMFIATPIDPLFLVLPFLAPSTASKNSESTKRLFLASSDYLDDLAAQSPHVRSLIRMPPVQELLEARMGAICDSVDAGDETMYRLNETKLLQELLQKAQRTAEHGLPASMEEKFVRRALEVPLQCIKRDGTSLSTNDVGGGGEDAVESSSSDATPATTVDSLDSQTSISSSDTLGSVVSTAASSLPSLERGDLPPKASDTAPESVLPAIVAPEGIPQLLRIRVALDYIMSSYLPSPLQEKLNVLLSSSSPSNSTSFTTPMPDFGPLIAHLAHLSTLRSQAYASRSLGDFSRKRSLLQEGEDYDGETGESRREKRRKLEEEEKRKKAGESRGVRDLKKVDVKGMKKMSDFFKRKA